MENASFAGEGRTGATSDSPARNGIRRSATPRRRTAPPLRTTGCLNEPESTLPVLAFRLSSPKSARAQVHITANLAHQIQAGSASPSTFAVRLEEYLRPLGAPNFREAQAASSRNDASLAVALNCGMGSRSLNALVNALDKLHTVRGANSSTFGLKY